jgi:hypothetical protein
MDTHLGGYVRTMVAAMPLGQHQECQICVTVQARLCPRAAHAIAHATAPGHDAMDDSINEKIHPCAPSPDPRARECLLFAADATALDTACRLPVCTAAHSRTSVPLHVPALPRSARPVWQRRARLSLPRRDETRRDAQPARPHPCALGPLRPSRDSRPIANLRRFSGTAPLDVVHVAVMPALLVDTNPRPASSSDASSTSARSRQRSESASPNRPPVSPITPRASVAQLAPVERTEAQPRPAAPPPATFRQQPPSVAIAESDNPDVIALRSAISLLQLQREKSKRDLKALAELKSVAVADPAAFAQSIHENRAHAAQSYSDVLTPTLASSAPGADSDARGAQSGVETRKDSADVGAPASAPKFPAIPQPQNIVRCPPINWEKYHIVGEPLDKMHEEQKKWPGQPEPPRTQSGARAPPHAIAAPYAPFTTDGIGKPASAKHPLKGNKKSPA